MKLKLFRTKSQISRSGGARQNTTTKNLPRASLSGDRRKASGVKNGDPE